MISEARPKAARGKQRVTFCWLRILVVTRTPTTNTCKIDAAISPTDRYKSLSLSRYHGTTSSFPPPHPIAQLKNWFSNSLDRNDELHHHATTTIGDASHKHILPWPAFLVFFFHPHTHTLSLSLSLSLSPLFLSLSSLSNILFLFFC